MKIWRATFLLGLSKKKKKSNAIRNIVRVALSKLFCFHLHLLPSHLSERSQRKRLMRLVHPKSLSKMFNLCRSIKGKSNLGLSKLNLHHEFSSSINNALITFCEAFSRWLLSVFGEDKNRKGLAHAHVHARRGPREGDQVEVLSRAFVHPGAHMVPLNKLSHPCCLLSKYWSRRDSAPDGSATSWGLTLQTERTYMDKLRCFSNSSKRLSDGKARTDTTLPRLPTVAFSRNFPVRGRGGTRSYGIWLQDAAAQGLPAARHAFTRRARPRTDWPGRKPWRLTPHQVHCGIVPRMPRRCRERSGGNRTWMGFGKHKIPPMCKVMLRTFKEESSSREASHWDE